MSEIAVELTILVILLLFNGMFSMSEIAVISARRLRLQQKADEGNGGAKAALQLAESPDNFLSMIQVGITLIGIVTGVLGGATLTKEIAVMISQVALLAPYAETIAFVVVVIMITYLSLIIGELVPKSIGIRNPEGIAIFVARPMQLLAKITQPLVWLLSASTGFILKVLGLQGNESQTVTEDEIRSIIKEGARTGVVNQVEQQMVERIFQLGDIRITGLMIPRPDMAWMDITDDHRLLLEYLQESPITHLVITQDTPDNVIGMIRMNDVLVRQLKGEPLNLRAQLHEALFLPETTTAFNAIRQMREKGEQAALVIDEHSGVQGLITLDRILEAIIDDAIQAPLHDMPTVITCKDGTCLADGMLPIDKLKGFLNLKTLPDEESYETLGGFMMSQLGRIPLVMDHFDFEGWRFEVVDMDGHRVDKVMLKTLATPPMETNAPTQHHVPTKTM